MAITRATNLAAVGSGLGDNPAQPVQVGAAVTIGGAAGVVTATTFSGNATGLSGEPSIIIDSVRASDESTFLGGLKVTGVTTSTTFSGNITGVAATFTGNVTVGGTLTYDDVTNIDSIGLITARNGLQVLSGITTISGQTNLANVNVSAAGTVATLSASTLSVSGQSTLANVNVATGVATVAGQTSLANVSVSAGSTFTGRISVNAGFANTGPLQERVNVVGNKLSAATNINLSDSNIHYFTTNETGTATPNLRWDGSTTLASKMSLGDTISVTLISKPNNAGYYAQLTIDGGAVTEEWNGGSAPASANSDGYDVLTYQIVKIAASGTPNTDFLVLANASNFT